jgi:predicted  nucleic acid-binding Zn-ribbon protein
MPYTVDLSIPLLLQAEQRLIAAKRTEAAARLAWDGHRANPALQQAVTAAVQETRQAQSWLDQLQRSRDALPAALEEARRDLVRAESAYAQVMETARMTIARAQQRVQQAQEQAERLEHDWVTIVGTEAGRPA